MSKISVVNLCKEYDKGKPVVIDANLEIQEKEFIVFVGPSGCGKSTMLRMIAGLEEITSGDLFIDGKRVNDIAPMHRNIAMVFQNYALYPHMTIRKNLEFGLANMKVDKATIKQKVEATSKMLGLEEYLNRKPAALSGGQRQRVAVGRALIKDSDIFLMDEPLSNLDAQLRVQMRAEITQLCKRIGATTIYVTHDQTEAMTMADRIVIMRDGVIQQIGTPREVYNDPQNLFVASFIGSPKINILPSTISDSKLKFGVVEMSLDADVLAKLDGRAKASVGIRPEDFSLEPMDNCVEMPLRVDYTELLGSEILVYSYNDSYNLILKLDKQFAPNTGDMITAYVEKEKLYLFDTETERRI